MLDKNKPEPGWRFQGSGFESMHDTLTAEFGGFDAAPTTALRDFRWRADLRSNGLMTLVSGHYRGEWDLRSNSDTPEMLSIALPRMGALNARLGQTTIEGFPGRITLTNNCEAERFFVRGDLNVHDVVFLDWSLVSQTVAALIDKPFSGSLDLRPILDTATREGQVIDMLLQTVIDGMRHGGPLLQSPLALAHLAQALTDLLVRNVPHRFSYLLDQTPSLIAPRHIHRAVEFMRTYIDKPITMGMVAADAGISVRALENGFRAFKDTTPAAYLRGIRLEAARSDLSDPLNDRSVKAICLKWGFFHFGRFSATYRMAYGESPSDTKRRAALEQPLSRV